MTMPPTGSDPLLPATLHHVDELRIVGMTAEFPCTTTEVWDAVRLPAILEQWAPYTAEHSLSELGPVAVTLFGDGGEHFGMECEVLAATEPDGLTAAELDHTWGPDVLRWRITASPLGATLHLLHELADPGMASAVAAGWHLCFAVLGSVLESADDDPLPPIVASRARDFGWDELNERYAEALGVDAARVW